MRNLQHLSEFAEPEQLQAICRYFVLGKGENRFVKNHLPAKILADTLELIANQLILGVVCGTCTDHDDADLLLLRVEKVIF